MPLLQSQLHGLSQSHLRTGTPPPSDLSCVNRPSTQNSFGLVMLFITQQSLTRGSHSAERRLRLPVLPEDSTNSVHQVEQYQCTTYISASEGTAFFPFLFLHRNQPKKALVKLNGKQTDTTFLFVASPVTGFI